MRRKLIRLSHFIIKGVIYLMWVAVGYQAIVYFVNPIRVESYRLAVEYWRGLWKIIVA
jgi:hypothetical protein